MSGSFRAEARTVVAPMEGCWRRIGVGGDRSCAELETFIHCRNCPVLTAAARTFFDREAPPGYLESWREILEQPEQAADGDAVAVLVFRRGSEWLALPARVLVEITPPRKVHRLPHRHDTLLEGLVNIRGQLQVCVDLGRLIGVERSADDAAAAATSSVGPAARLLVVERVGDRGTERWVFGVDEVAGVQRVPAAALRAVPSTVGGTANRSTAALFAWQDKTVGLFDEQRLLDGLRAQVSG
jgi:chemotaxis-related protein WspD